MSTKASESQEISIDPSQGQSPTTPPSDQSHFWKSFGQFFLLGLTLQSIGGFLAFQIMDTNTSYAHGIGAAFQALAIFLMSILAGIPISLILLIFLGISSYRKKQFRRLRGQLTGFLVLLLATLTAFWMIWS